MVKLVWLLKRKPGVTHAQFRAHYENSHSRLAHKYIGHLMTAYVRNYPSEVGRAGDMQPIDWEYDCVAEWHMPSEEALAEIWRILAHPVVRAEFKADEEHFLDVASVVRIKCRDGDILDTGTGDGHATLAIVREQGAPI